MIFLNIGDIFFKATYRRKKTYKADNSLIEKTLM